MGSDAMRMTERRVTAAPVVLHGDGMSFSGYAAIFDSKTYVGPRGRGFNEQISRGAFTKVIKSGVRGVFNHNPDYLLGTTTAGTLRLKEDDTGLFDEIDLPDTSTGRDVAALVRRGDLSGQSFQFTVARDEWTKEPGGHTQLRTIHEIGSLIDVGPVTSPQYLTTTASVRHALLTAPEEVRSAVLERAADDLECDSCGATFSSDDYAAGDSCPDCGKGTLVEMASRSVVTAVQCPTCAAASIAVTAGRPGRPVHLQRARLRLAQLSVGVIPDA